MKTLMIGSNGPGVQLLQLALNRWGGASLVTDGVFGPVTKAALLRFQRAEGITPDGIAGAQTHRALLPWYTGAVRHVIRRGDTLWALSRRYGGSIDAIRTANPGLDPDALRVGSEITVPLDFPVVPTDIAYSSSLIAYCVRGLKARYPFLTVGEAGRSVMGRPLYALTLGTGENRVLYNASHHANEWITTPLLLKFTEELAEAYARGGTVYDRSAAELLSYATLTLLPAVNPDGIDLVTGELTGGGEYRAAVKLAERYPRYPFPDGWKANIRGVDLNLQYPALWERAREIKYAAGITSPAPADFVGTAPLAAPESRAVYDLTLRIDPALVLAYHTQGEEIYWQFLDREPPNARVIAELFSRLSGYAAAAPAYAASFAGYKDWFIDGFDRPGFTVEAGWGTNPLPISDFDALYQRNLGILVYAALVT